MQFALTQGDEREQRDTASYGAQFGTRKDIFRSHHVIPPWSRYPCRLQRSFGEEIENFIAMYAKTSPKKSTRKQGEGGAEDPRRNLSCA